MIKFIERFISKIDLKFLFIAFVNFFVTLFTDPIFFNQVELANNLKYFLIKSIVLIFLILFWQGIPYLTNKIREKDEKTTTFLKYFCIYFGIMLIFLILTWPGNWRRDEFVILHFAKTLNMFYWQHWLTSLFYMFCLFIFPFPVSIVIIQIFIISLVVAYIMSEFHFIFPSRYTWILFIPFFLPPIILNNLYPLRFLLYSYLFLLLFASIIFKYLNKTNITAMDIGSWGTLTAIVSTWRTESIFFVATIPILLVILFYRHIKIKQFILLLIIIFSLSIPIMNIQEKGLKDRKYVLATIINPLATIIKTDFKSDNKQKDLEIINNVIDINAIKHSRLGMDVFWTPGDLRNTDENSISKITEVYLKLVKYNSSIFIKERSSSFARSNIGVPINNKTQDVFKTDWYHASEFSNKPLNTNLRLTVLNVLEIKKYSRFLFNIFYSPVIPFLILILLFIAGIFSKNKLLSLIPPIILIRTILVILTASGNLFMYYLSTYICGYAFLTMFLLSTFNGE